MHPLAKLFLRQYEDKLKKPKPGFDPTEPAEDSLHQFRGEPEEEGEMGASRYGEETELGEREEEGEADRYDQEEMQSLAEGGYVTRGSQYETDNSPRFYNRGGQVVSDYEDTPEHYAKGGRVESFQGEEDEYGEEPGHGGEIEDEEGDEEGETESGEPVTEAYGYPADSLAKGGRVGSGKRFEHIEHVVAGEGARDPKALAAFIGRKSLGKEKFQDLAAKGRRREAKKMSSGGQVTSDYQNTPEKYSKGGKAVGNYVHRFAKAMKSGGYC